MTNSRRIRAGALTALALAGSAPAWAQGLDQRVARSAGDVVQFHYAARPGVCGDGRGLLRIDGGFWTTTYGSYNDLTKCEAGPIRVMITKDRGEVIRIQTVA